MVAAKQQRKDATPAEIANITAGEFTLCGNPGVSLRTTYDMKKNQEPSANEKVDKKRAGMITSVNPHAT